ncbi:MAG: voltage-gated potassium channel [Actinomycetota bacterium]|nr:voltage-gated potassium channel [Actinomycetota bacterium]
MRLPALLSLIVLAYGVLGYSVLLGWSVLDSVYMTLITMTTVGYTEVQPMDAVGKVFTITLLIAGASLLLVTLTIAASVLQEDPVRERIRRRRMNRRIDGLTKHIIVAGYGRVGRTVAEALEEERFPYLVIDKNEGREKELIDDGVIYYVGDATTKEGLSAAGLERAHALISAVDDDAENIFITMVARSMKDDLWIVARAAEEASRVRLETAGANRVYSPFVTAGREMATAAAHPGVVDFIDVPAVATEALRLEELQVDHGSAFIGRSLGEIKGSTTALALRRATGELLTSPADTVSLTEGDVLLLLGERDELRPVEEKA